METLYLVLLVFHLLGWAVVFGGAFANLRTPKIVPGMVHGILTALVTGIAMVGLASAGVAGGDPNNVKAGIKLVIALVVAFLVITGLRRPEKATTGYVATIVGLTALNIAIAVLWT